MSDLIRFFASVVEVENGCWVRSDKADLRSTISVDGKTVLAYRWLYREMFGEVADQLHHTCENPACCNPMHLTPLTQREHKRLHRHTHCVRGHELVGENVYVRPDGQGRMCQVCKRERRKRHYEATKH